MTRVDERVRAYGVSPTPRWLVAFAVTVSIAAADAQPASGAAAGGPGTRPAELKPISVEQIAPWTSTAAANEQPGIGKTDNALTEGDQTAYLQEKAAAVWAGALDAQRRPGPHRRSPPFRSPSPWSASPPRAASRCPTPSWAKGRAGGSGD
jgi:hypothetical protein